MRFGFLGLLALCLSACGTAGVRVDPNVTASFQDGVTTYAEVVAALGPPTSSVTFPDGRRLAIYSYAQVRARPESFIPLVGAFVGGVDSQSETVSFNFDQNGILDGTTNSQMQLESEAPR